MRFSFRSLLSMILATRNSEAEMVRAALSDFWDAYRLQNEAMLNDTFDDEFLSQSGQSKTTRIASIVQPSFIVKSANVDSANAKIQVTGDRAVVRYRAWYTLVFQGKVHSATNESIDIFIKRNGQWRMFRETHTEKIQRVPVIES